VELLKQTWWLLKKDLLLEWRSRAMLTMIFFFTVLALSVFGLALQASPDIQRMVLPAMIWVVLSFAGTLGMGRLYASEQEEDALDALRMAPIASEAIFLAKHISLLIFMLSCAIWSVPLSAVMFQVDIAKLFPYAIPLFFLGLWGFAILGTFMETLLLQARFREALLPLLFLPVALPVTIAGARATAELLGVGGIPHTMFWLRFLVFFDLFFLVVSLWLFEVQLEQ